MRVASFDIFDTLLTRMVAHPTDLFLIVGEELRQRGLIAMSPEEFRGERIDAESKARQLFDHQETTFDEIYVQLAGKLKWTEDQARAARQVELEIERKTLRATPGGRRKLETARKTADRVFFLSDMYLPREFLERILREAQLWREGDRLVVSGESKSSKASGAMYARLREELKQVQSWRHLGDNAHADIKMAGQHGIETEHFTECHLTRYESAFRGSLQNSKIAAAIRYARLSAPHQSALWSIGVSVAGPLLFGFVLWTLEEARKRGVKRLYFISRDGEILIKIAHLIIAKCGWDIQVRYLYGSRQAWRPAAGEELDEWHAEWVMAIPTPTTLRSIFKRLAIPPQSIEGHALDAPLDFETRRKIWSHIKNSPIGDAAIQARKECRARAQRYLAQEGFEDDLPLGIVDIGWFGSMQRSVEAIIQTKRPLHGFYFGLWNGSSERRLSFWREQPGFRILPQTNITLFERFTAALHGSVLGYAEINGRVEPILEKDKTQPLIDWGLDLWQQSILKLTEVLLNSVDNIDPNGLFTRARGNFELFSQHPTPEEALAFGKIPLQDQGNEITAPSMLPNLTSTEILRAILDYRRRLPGWWMEGTLALTGNPFLRAFLWLKRLKHRAR